jgi:hypothetical protein
VRSEEFARASYRLPSVTPPAILLPERLPEGVYAVSGLGLETLSVRPVSQRVAAPATFHCTSTAKALGRALEA